MFIMLNKKMLNMFKLLNKFLYLPNKNLLIWKHLLNDI